MKTIRPLLVSLALIALALSVFGGLSRHEFVAFDDQSYITNNPEVASGVTVRGVAWAFTTFTGANWHPLTWLSHMADVQLFGMRPGAHHMVGLLFHMANTVLLFLVLRGMTGALWRSALVAALFAVHPLHVESVAWAAERKDLLSTLLGILTLGAYLAYARRPGAGRLIRVIVVFALGLLAKPMLVTIPFVLLLLDGWPLGRRAPGGLLPPRSGWLEKIPLFALSAVSSAVTWYAQSSAGAVSTLDMVPIRVRIYNAALSYLVYLGRTLWPRNLVVLYPYLTTLAWWQFMVALVVLALLCAGVLAAARKAPYLAVGWLWYLGTLVPVIGLIQVGAQATADRYTYVPLIGIFLMAIWGADGLLGRAPALRKPGAATALAVLAVLGVLSRTQAGYWQDSLTLFRHALKSTTGNWLLLNGMGEYLADHGDVRGARDSYEQALAVNPLSTQAHNNLGGLLAAQGALGEAMAHFRAAIRIDPSFASAYNNLGLALSVQGHAGEAIAQYHAALRIDPRQADAHYNLGVELMMRGDLEGAIGPLREAVRRNPTLSEAWAALGDVCSRTRRDAEARAAYRKALAIDPGLERARRALEILGPPVAVSGRG